MSMKATTIVQVLIALILCATYQSLAQTVVINLKNPSFEGTPKQGEFNPLPVDFGWVDVKAFGNEESAPDIHPVRDLGVTKAAKDGKTYLGIVARDNNTSEAVRQQLATPLLKGVRYKFSLWACRSATFRSGSRRTLKPVDYLQPCILELWASTGNKDDEKLEATPSITATDWQKFNFEFTPTKNCTFFTLKAFSEDATNGHILVDSLSALSPIDLNPPIANTNKSADKTLSKTKKVAIATPSVFPLSTPTNIQYTTEKTDKEPEKTRSVTRLLAIPFDTDAFILPTQSHADLDDLADFLKKNPCFKAHIEGFTNKEINAVEEAKELAQKRAEAVRDYLVKKGITSSRLFPKGKGKTESQCDKLRLVFAC